MKYNTFVKENRDVTMSGTKRYENKSGEYYLQNAPKFGKNNLKYLDKKSLTKPYLGKFNNNKYLIRVNKNKIFDELVPIPKIKQNNKLKCDNDKRNLKDAVNNAKYIRRYQYSKNLNQKQILKNKEIENNQQIFLSKIKCLQIWWKTIFQIIKIQKFIKGCLYRKKLKNVMEKKEKYSEKIMNLVKVIKKIFWKNFLLLKLINKSHSLIYYLNKWKDIISKKKILNELIKYSNSEVVNEYKYNSDINTQNLTSRSFNELSREKEQQINSKKKVKNINKSLIDLYNHTFYNRNSSQPFLFTKNNNNINNNKSSLGLVFSSKNINRKKINNGFNQFNYKIKHKKRNKKKYLFNKNTINLEKGINLINKSIRTKNHKNNMTLKPNSKNNNNIYEDNSIDKQNIQLNKQIKNKINIINNYKTDIKNKSNLKQNKNQTNNPNVNTLTRHKKLKTNSNIKKNKVYENELYLYNNYQTLEFHKENYFTIPRNKSLREYTEHNLEVSQFNDLFNESMMKGDQNMYAYFDNINENKEEVIHIQEGNEIENSNKKILLKNYFQIWRKINISRKLLKSLLQKKKINSGVNILSNVFKKQIHKSFFEKIKMIYKALEKDIFLELIYNFKKKIFIKFFLAFYKKYLLHKYFNIYKNKINNKAIIEKIKEYQKNVIKMNKDRKNINKDIPIIINNLNEKLITSIPINNDLMNDKSNSNIGQTNNCYIINNLNYINNTNNIDIKLSYDNNNLKSIHSKLIELTKKNIKQNKPYIGLYKKNNNHLFYNVNNEFSKSNRNKNPISHSHLFTKQIQNKNNNKFNKVNDTDIMNNISLSYEVNLNKSLVLSKYSNQLNWDLITKKNQLIMIINIIERHRKLKESELFNKYFERWKNKLNQYKTKNIISYNKPINHSPKRYISFIKPNDIIKINERNQNYSLREGVYKPNTFEKISFSKSLDYEENQDLLKMNKDKKKSNFKNLKISSLYTESKKNPKKYYTYSVPNLSDIKKENINSVYKRKSITGASIFLKKKSPNNKNNIMITEKENIIYNKKYGYMSQENYHGFKKCNKIEEMEISFGNSNNNENSTISIENNKKQKQVNPFNSLEDPEIQDNFIEINEENNVILEDIEENTEFGEDNENLILNLKSYFEERKEKFFYNTINSNCIKREFYEKYEMKKYHSEKYIL